MTKRRGRPKSSEPIREVQYRLRITPEEHKFLKDVSENTGLPISHLIRAGVLSYCEDIIRSNMFKSPRRNGKTEQLERLRKVIENTKKMCAGTTDAD